MSMNSAVTGTSRLARAREHLLGAVEHQRAVRQPGQRIVQRPVHGYGSRRVESISNQHPP
jgi:hypothetical protein